MITQLRPPQQILSKLLNRVMRFRLHYLAFLGPGLIATAAGNDAGGIATYSVAGAQFGYSILWIMVPLTVSFILVQEMSARLGAVTRKGFSDLVRENFSIKTTVAMMILLLMGNAGIVVSEFAGIAASLELFGITKYVSVPFAAAFIWWLIVKGNYHKVERVFLLMSGILLSYILAAFLAKPDPAQILTGLIIPTIHPNLSFLMYSVALVGTTIAPFMQIYAQASVVEKGITVSDLKLERLDTIVGTIFANIVAVFIIIATAATLHPLGIRIETAADAAQALVPFAGNYARILFGVGLLGASLLAAGVVPLTTAFAIANAFGWESGVNRSLDEAPIFYAIFTFLIVMAATIILTPAVSLIQILVGFQVVNGILLPIELVFMMKLANNATLMGKYRNGKVFNLVIWATIIIVGSASLILVGSVVLGYLGRIWYMFAA